MIVLTPSKVHFATWTGSREDSQHQGASTHQVPAEDVPQLSLPAVLLQEGTACSLLLQYVSWHIELLLLAAQPWASTATELLGTPCSFF